MTPPLVITDDDVDRAVEPLSQGIEDATEVSDAQVAPYAGW